MSSSAFIDVKNALLEYLKTTKAITNIIPTNIENSSENNINEYIIRYNPVIINSNINTNNITDLRYRNI